MDSDKKNFEAGLAWKNALIPALILGLAVIIFTLAYDLRREIDGWCLFRAAHLGEIPVVAKYFRRGVSPTIQNSQGRTLIEFAAAESRFGMVKFLLDSADCYTKGQMSHRAKMVAAHLCSTPLLAFLTDYGCFSASDSLLIVAPMKIRANTHFSRGKSTISSHQRLETLRFLLRTGCYPPEQLGEALSLAVQYRELQGAVALLLEKNAPVGYQEAGTGNTLLAKAAESHCPPIVEALLKGGADPAIRNKEGKTAYDVAVKLYGRVFSRNEAAILDLLKPDTNGNRQKPAAHPQEQISPSPSPSPALSPAPSSSPALSSASASSPSLVPFDPSLPPSEPEKDLASSTPVAVPIISEDPAKKPVPLVPGKGIDPNDGGDVQVMPPRGSGSDSQTELSGPTSGGPVVPEVLPASQSSMPNLVPGGTSR